MMPTRRTIELGQWLRSKRNFLMFSLLAFGVPLWVIFLWTFWNFGNIGDFVLITVLSIGAALLWGIGMWHFFAFMFPSFRTEKGKNDAA